MNGQPPYNPYQQQPNPYGQQPYGQYGYQQPGLRPSFDFGWVFTNGWRIFFKNLPVFLLMAVIVFSPLIIYGAVLDYPDVTSGHASYDDKMAALMQTLKFTGGLMVATLILQPILSAAVIYATVEDLSGRPPSFSRCLGIGLRRLLPSLAVSLVAGLLIMVGILGVIIGAIFMVCATYVAVPASVIERPGIWGAVKRSFELTKGFRWWILLLLIAVGGIVGITSGILEVVLVDKNPETQVIAAHSWTAYKWLHIIGQIIQAMIGATRSATAYVSMRNAKDGVGVGELAKVFD
jgi:hypothetical protein